VCEEGLHDWLLGVSNELLSPFVQTKSHKDLTSEEEQNPNRVAARGHLGTHVGLLAVLDLTSGIGVSFLFPRK
jgi:hypothetical protein